MVAADILARVSPSDVAFESRIEEWTPDLVHTDGRTDAIGGTAPALHEGAVRLDPYAAVWLHDSNPEKAGAT
jgi:hypothetical protein